MHTHPIYVPLPAGLTDPRSDAGAVFERVAETYDRGRPSYPPDAIIDLISRCGIGAESAVLEIGCGSGQFTRCLAPSGARIVCVEPGTSLAGLARENLADLANVVVHTSRFEDFDAPDAAFDVVVAATSFHWIDPTLGYSRAAELLRGGGHLALVTNAHSAGGSHTQGDFAVRVRDLHRRLVPEIGDWTFPSYGEINGRATAGGTVAEVWTRVERKMTDPVSVDDLFEPPRVTTYPWTITYDAEEYRTMLASQSGYALCDAARRDELLDRITDLVDAQPDGVVTKEYVTVVAIARRRDRRRAPGRPRPG